MKKAIAVQKKIKKKRSAAFYAFALSGAAALMYEVIWTRELSLIFGSSVYAVSTMLTAFMSGLTLGAYIGGRFADRVKNLYKTFGFLEAGIGLFGLVTIPLINYLSPVYFYLYHLFKENIFLFYLAQFLLAFLIMLIPTSLMGATFPIVSKIETKRIEEVGEDVGSVYSINTLGSIIGSFSAGFLLIPTLGIKKATLVAAGLNLIVSILMFYKGKAGTQKLLGILSILCIAVFFFFAIPEEYFPFSFYHLHRYKTYSDYVKDKENIKPVFIKDGLYGRVAVMQDGFGDYFLANDGKIEGSTVITDQKTTSLLAHLPLSYARKSEKVLIIGLGTGQTLREVLKHAEVNEVVCVEINPDILEAAKYFVPQEVFEDPRVRFVLADGRHYLLLSNEKFDVVSSEPSYPYSQGVSQLFTKEFYELVEKHLTDGGIFCQWIPLYLLAKSDFFSMVKTFGTVYPYFDIWHASYPNLRVGEIPLDGDAVLIGSREPLKPYTEVKQLTLALMPLKDDFSYLGGNQLFHAYVRSKNIAFITDDLNLLEFRAPLNHLFSLRKVN